MSKKSENANYFFQEQKPSFFYTQLRERNSTLMHTYCNYLVLLFVIRKLYSKPKGKKSLGPFYLSTNQLQFHLRLTKSALAGVAQ